MPSYARRMVLLSFLGAYSYERGDWFDSLSTGQLKQLCRAAKISDSGDLNELIQRLHCEDRTKAYCGTPKQACVEMCQERHLPFFGSKLSIVTRLLKHESRLDSERAQQNSIIATNASTYPLGNLFDQNTAMSPSREILHAKVMRKAAISFDQNSTEPLSTEILHAKVAKMVLNVTTLKNSLNSRNNTKHAPAVYTFMRQLIHEECIKNGLVKTNPCQAWDSLEAIVTAFNHFFEHMEYPGHGQEEFYAFCMALQHAFECIIPSLSPEARMETVDWLEEMFVNVRRFNIGGEHLLPLLTLLDPDWDPRLTAKRDGAMLLCEFRQVQHCSLADSELCFISLK